MQHVASEPLLSAVRRHNRSLIEHLIATTTQMIAAQPALYGTEPTVFSLSQSDNVDFCQDPEEQAIYEEEGSQVGPQLRGVNAIADAVGPLYPDVLIDTFAYLNTLPVPAVTKPRPNVIIRICIASCNFAAEYTDPVRLRLSPTVSSAGSQMR